MRNASSVPIGRIQTFDVDVDVDDVEDIIESSAPSGPAHRRGPGRPKGSLGRVNEDQDINLSDFSFLRAVVQGIDAKKAALRYLSGHVYLSSEACNAYENKLRAILQRTIKVMLDESERMTAGNNLDVLSAPTLRAVALGPSLEKFASQFDSDMYSESELQELYQEEYGVGHGQVQAESVTLGYGIKAKLNAINWLSNRIAKKPSPADPLENWVDLGLVPKLRQHGIITVGNLLDWVNLQGRSFYLRIKGLGVTRGRRLALWLMDNEEHLGGRLDRRIRFQSFDVGTAIDLVDARQVATTSHVVGIVPLERMAWPMHLLGRDGVFRSHRPNTFGACDDKQAIQAWFVTLASTASPATQISYQRAIERLILWAIVEKQAPLSSLVTEHFVAFREFLRDPPPHWSSKFPTVRHSPDWRPLRGKMKEASIQQTFSAISSLYSTLVTCGYLTANAVSSVRTSVKRDMRMDVMRSFAEEDLQAISRTMSEMEAGPNKRRLRAIILLLQTGGFRRGEAISLRYSNLTPLRKDNRLTDMWVATFKGKGNKERKVPIKAETYEALQDHCRDRLELIEKKTLRKVKGITVTTPILEDYAGVLPEDTPLLSVLDGRMAQGRSATTGETPGDALVRANLDGALSSGRIHSILKAFFQKVSERTDLVTGHANFLKASSHWLRHTFGLQAMIASKGDLAAVQQILGHADISTTGIYMKADLNSRVAVIDGIKGAV